MVAGSSANAEIGAALSRLRDRSRDLVRNNPYAAKAVQAVVSNLIGTGILPRARSGHASINEMTDKLWARFAESCDADGLSAARRARGTWRSSTSAAIASAPRDGRTPRGWSGRSRRCHADLSAEVPR